MFKKLFTGLIIATLFVTAQTHCSDQNSMLQAKLDHIAQQKQAIMLELKKTITLGKKAIEHMKSLFGDEYEQKASKVTTVINTIITSQEFHNTLDKSTDYYITSIVNEGMNFDNIIYSPQDNSIDQKINDELAKAFPSLDAQTEQLFNIFYVTMANVRGIKLLLEKLTECADNSCTANELACNNHN